MMTEPCNFFKREIEEINSARIPFDCMGGIITFMITVIRHDNDSDCDNDDNGDSDYDNILMPYQ